MRKLGNTQPNKVLSASPLQFAVKMLFLQYIYINNTSNRNVYAMILDFSISNFRSIKAPQMISFEATDSKHLDDYYVVSIDKYRILKIAYILGGNASGKSNILKAFSMFPMLLLQPCENKNSKIEYSRFALDKNAEQELSVMKINFICEKKKYCYEVHFNNDIVKQESLTAHPFGELRAHKVYERTLNTDTMVSTIKWGREVSFTSQHP